MTRNFRPLDPSGDVLRWCECVLILMLCLKGDNIFLLLADLFEYLTKPQRVFSRYKSLYDSYICHIFLPDMFHGLANKELAIDKLGKNR